MATVTTWLGNFTSATSAFAAEVTKAKEPGILKVPSNLHVFEKYYSTHSSYQYTEEYSFKDKLLIVDSRQDLDSKFGNYFEENLEQGKATIENTDRPGVNEFLSSHLHKSFFNWSRVGIDSESLRDFLKLDVSKSKEIFQAHEKNIYLDYSYKHSSKIDIYGFSFSDNKPLHLTKGSYLFGKRKNDIKKLSSVYATKTDNKGCLEIIDSYDEKQVKNSEDISDGFDGVCDTITISAGRNHNFPAGVNSRWTTPYAAYKYEKQHWWDEQYYYYNLGDFSVNQKSNNLVQDSNNSKVWFIDYDDVFSLAPESNNKVKLKLNDKSTFIRGLEGKTKAKEDFLKISSLLEFKLEFNNLSNWVTHTFTMEDVVNDRVILDFQGSNGYLISNVSLSIDVQSKYQDHVKIAKINTKDYRVNLDGLSQSNKIFKSVEFEIGEHAKKLLPSELLQNDKLAEYFYFVTRDDKKLKLTRDLLKNLEIKGEVDDEEGTVDFSYKFNDQTKQVNISGMKKVPNLNEIEMITASNDYEARKELKNRFPNTSDYFWENLGFKLSEDDIWKETQIIKKAYEKNKNQESHLHGLVSKTSWKVDEFKIKVENNNNISLLAKEDKNLVFSELQDLFELRPNSYADKFSLKDYKYNLMPSDSDDEIKVRVTILKTKIQEKLGIAADYDLNKDYFFRNARKVDKHILPRPSMKQTSDIQPEQERWFDWLFKSENAVVTSAGCVFSGSSLYMLFKKLGFLKSKII